MASKGIGVQVDAALTSFRFNHAELSSLLHSTHGMVARDLAVRAIRVESAAKQNATGRPGPNVVTDRLRSSITWALGSDLASVYADIGSAVVYARRIELGFTGVDSLGRYYDQPAYPYLRPALDAARI